MDDSNGKNEHRANSHKTHRRTTAKEIEPSSQIIVVAFDASKEILKEPLEWTLANIAQAGDCITILALLTLPKISCKAWKFSKLRGIECIAAGCPLEAEANIKDYCRKVLREVKTLRDTKKVHVRVKVVKSGSKGVAAREAKSLGASWVVLDRHLKKDGKFCKQQLDCNVLLVRQSDAKILQLNLRRTTAGAAGSLLKSPYSAQSSLLLPTSFDEHSLLAAEIKQLPMDFSNIPANKSPQPNHSDAEDMTYFTSTEQGTSYLSTSDSNSSPSFPYLEEIVHGGAREDKSNEITQKMKIMKFLESCSGVFSPEADKIQECFSPQGSSEFTSKQTARTVTDLRQLLGIKESPLNYLNYAGNELLKDKVTFSRILDNKSGDFSRQIATTTACVHPSSARMSVLPAQCEEDATLDSREEADKSCLHNFLSETQRGCETAAVETLNGQSQENPDSKSPLQMSSSSRRALACLPPLCSACRYKAPRFGRPPQMFTYQELKLATDGFSQANFLAEGGFGSVHRGVLPEGQTIAVKRHKPGSLQGDLEFFAEVEALSCAQHRNVVTLMGYCMEERRRLLVYEFICNGSLDSHLYGHDKPVLNWQSRQRIAIGAARGLRYLHEECRVGCIIHRDVRPNNILLTHDFEPMVGDFGLARWKPDGDLGVETQVIGTFGYLAPEYVQSGHITEKTDVYSFGVVLLELATGRKAIDYSQPKGQQCLVEWARPLLENCLCHELADPQLQNLYCIERMSCMLQAASLCIRRDPHLRPKMSEMLQFLEGNIVPEATGFF